MDGTKEEAQNGPEWQVSMPEGTSATVAHKPGTAERARARLVSCAVKLKTEVSGFAKKVWKIGADDPRKAVYGIKLGIALTLVSLFYYVRPLYDGVGGNAVWAIMTVVLVFEYTVGGSMHRGFNRAAGTMSAAALALGMHWVASKSGKKFEPVVASGSVFLLAAAAAFSRFIPTVKAQFDYGVSVFIMTYSFVAVSGYRVEELAALALQRISTIAIGFFVCLAVCVLICPVWSGQELHLLTARNMEKLADATEGCVEDYFAEPEKRAPAKSEGYKCVLNSKASEDSQANLAWWEPPHGRFGFRHPYGQYTKVGAAMRHCAYCVEALNSCVGAAPEHAPRLLGDVCTRLGTQCARVLKEASSSISAMTISRTLGFAVAEMNAAVHELQGDLRALPSRLAEEPTETSLIEAMPLFTVALLLIEISARVKEVVDDVHTLATLARFNVKPGDDGEDMKAVTEMEVHPMSDMDSDASPENLTSTPPEQDSDRVRNPAGDKQV